MRVARIVTKPVSTVSITSGFQSPQEVAIGWFPPALTSPNISRRNRAAPMAPATGGSGHFTRLHCGLGGRI